MFSGVYTGLSLSVRPCVRVSACPSVYKIQSAGGGIKSHSVTAPVWYEISLNLLDFNIKKPKE